MIFLECWYFWMSFYERRCANDNNFPRDKPSSPLTAGVINRQIVQASCLESQTPLTWVSCDISSINHVHNSCILYIGSASFTANGRFLINSIWVLLFFWWIYPADLPSKVVGFFFLSWRLTPIGGSLSVGASVKI